MGKAAVSYEGMGQGEIEARMREDREARKLKRRQRRKANCDRVLLAIQTAETPQGVWRWGGGGVGREGGGGVGR